MLAAALSAWPSNSDASCNAAVSNSRPASPYAAATPATIAAADRAETARMGDRVAAVELHTGRCEPDDRARRAERPHHEVGLVGGHVLATLAAHPHDQTAVHDADVHFVPDVQRHAERVEAGAQVRAGSGHRDPDAGRHASSSAVATAPGSTGTGSTATMPSIAVSGSFRPWPVTVQTTTEPFGRRPSAAVASRPAMLAADAGSTKIPSCRASSR